MKAIRCYEHTYIPGRVPIDKIVDEDEYEFYYDINCYFCGKLLPTDQEAYSSMDKTEWYCNEECIYQRWDELQYDAERRIKDRKENPPVYETKSEYHRANRGPGY